jgi:ribosomal protein L7/L12
MSVNNTRLSKLIEEISNLEVQELVELVSLLKTRFGVVTTGSIGIANEEEKKDVNKAEEEEEFSVVVKNLGIKKLAVIKVIKSECFKTSSTVDIHNMFKGEKGEAVSLTVAEKLSKVNAQKLSDLLTDAGAEVLIST